MVLLDADTRDPADPPTPLKALLLKERSLLFPAEVVLAGCLFPRQCDNCGGYDQYEAGDLVEVRLPVQCLVAWYVAATVICLLELGMACPLPKDSGDSALMTHIVYSALACVSNTDCVSFMREMSCRILAVQ